MNDIELKPLTPDRLRLTIADREIELTLDDALDFQFQLACALSLMEQTRSEPEPATMLN